jgi:hypothetical protein
VLIRFVSSFIVVILGTCFAVSAPPDAKKFGWYSDYAAAKAEAKRTGKPMLVVFRCER